jgi:hypothetical protein
VHSGYRVGSWLTPGRSCDLRLLALDFSREFAASTSSPRLAPPRWANFIKSEGIRLN